MIGYQAARPAGPLTWPFNAQGRLHEAAEIPKCEYLIV